MGLATGVDEMHLEPPCRPFPTAPPLPFNLIFNCERKADLSVVHKNSRGGQNKTSRLSTQE